MPTKTHGGAREGAGRKSQGKTPVSYKLRSDLVQKMRDAGYNQTELIETLLDSFFKSRGA